MAHANQPRGREREWSLKCTKERRFALQIAGSVHICKSTNNMYYDGYSLQQKQQDTGVSYPGAFKLDHLQPDEPILF